MVPLLLFYVDRMMLLTVALMLLQWLFSVGMPQLLLSLPLLLIKLGLGVLRLILKGVQTKGAPFSAM